MRGNPARAASLPRTESNLNVPEEGELLQEIGSTAAFLGQGEAVAHFGLGLRGSHPVYRVRVVWNRQVPGVPSLEQNEMVFLNVPVRSTLVVHKDKVSGGIEGENLPSCVPQSGKLGTVLQQEARRSFVRRKIAPPVSEL